MLKEHATTVAEPSGEISLFFGKQYAILLESWMQLLGNLGAIVGN
jgi:hypothetical protein